MTSPDLQFVETDELSRVCRGDHDYPHAILGPHIHDGRVTLRVLEAHATGVVARGPWGETRLEREHLDIWSGVLPGPGVPQYHLVIENWGESVVQDDPYRFEPTLSDFDLHLIREGNHELVWTKLGAHVREYDGVFGTAFAVWAPAAKGVRVAPATGPRLAAQLPMRKLGESGVWELFVPGIGPGMAYQFQVLGADGVWRDKADPCAFQAETGTGAHSIVQESHYQWGDGFWMDQRSARRPGASPMSIYELHVGSWRSGQGWDELADELPDYLNRLGFTHVELMPVMQHPYEGSWGYQLTSYFAPDSRRGDPDGLRRLIDRLHQAGIGVILDWVPAHFAVDKWSLGMFDGTPLYEDPEPWRGWHPEWQTFIFNFGRPEVCNFLYANALYWLQEFHADGLRVDAVSSMLYLDYARPYGNWFPNRYGGNENLEAVWFLQKLNHTVAARVPGAVMIAEESTAWPGITRSTGDWGLGFDLKWNMGWMHDTLDYLGHPLLDRHWHREQLAHTLEYAWSEKYVLPLSHDEVVHGKGSLIARMPGYQHEKFAGLRAYFGFMWAYPGKKLLFMGDEFAQPREWNAHAELDWDLLAQRDHAGVQTLVGDLNRCYRETPALWSNDNDPDAFAWLSAEPEDPCVFAFLRTSADGSSLGCVSNFGPYGRELRIGVPISGEWDVIVNTNAGRYHDSGEPSGFRLGAVEVDDADAQDPAYLQFMVPALTTLWLRPV